MKKILVIDDDVEKTVEGEEIKKIIRSIGAEVEFVSDGEKGVGMVKNHNYDLILLDFEFKRQRRQGSELLDMIRIFNTKVPVLSISGSDYANHLMVRKRKKGIRYCQGFINKHSFISQPEKAEKKLKKFLI